MKIISFIPLSPLVLIVVSVIWIYEFGLAALPGILFLVLFIPIQMVVGKFFAKMR